MDTGCGSRVVSVPARQIARRAEALGRPINGATLADLRADIIANLQGTSRIERRRRRPRQHADAVARTCLIGLAIQLARVGDRVDVELALFVVDKGKPIGLMRPTKAPARAE